MKSKAKIDLINKSLYLSDSYSPGLKVTEIIDIP